MLIRPARPDDIAAILPIYVEAVLHGTASFEIEPPDEAEMLRRYLAITEADFPYVVAVDPDRTLLGYAYAGPFRPRIAYRFTVENSVYVAPEAQKRGVGRALMEAVIDGVRGEGLPADGGGDRRQRQCRLHRPAPRLRLHRCRPAAGHRLQVRPLDRHRADAAPARGGGFKPGAGSERPARIDGLQHRLDLADARLVGVCRCRSC